MLTAVRFFALCSQMPTRPAGEVRALCSSGGESGYVPPSQGRLRTSPEALHEALVVRRTRLFIALGLVFPPAQAAEASLYLWQ